MGVEEERRGRGGREAKEKERRGRGRAKRARQCREAWEEGRVAKRSCGVLGRAKKATSPH